MGWEPHLQVQYTSMSLLADAFHSNQYSGTHFWLYFKLDMFVYYFSVHFTASGIMHRYTVHTCECKITNMIEW